MYIQEEKKSTVKFMLLCKTHLSKFTEARRQVLSCVRLPDRTDCPAGEIFVRIILFRRDKSCKLKLYIKFINIEQFYLWYVFALERVGYLIIMNLQLFINYKLNNN